MPNRLPTLLLALLLLALPGCGADEPSAPSPSGAAVDSASGPRGAAATRADDRPTILFLGDSITAGYGLEPEQAFPALVQQRIDSLGWDYRVVNAGLSGETSAGGLRRLDWLLRQPIDVLVLELGGNDGLRGVPAEVTRQNLQAIIDRTRDRYPDARIVLAGMQIPPNLGPAYTEQFRRVFPELAAENDLPLIPFILEGVGGNPSLNQPDGIHPTARGHELVAETVWETLRPVLEADRVES